jgi:hypothetical protein
MSTPAASIHQASKFVRDALGDPDSNQMQYFLANSKFFKQLAFADFSKIDEAAFVAALGLDSPSIPWRPVGGYADKIAEWNKLRGWGFTKAQIAKLATALADQDHLDPLHPTGVSLWLGQTLAYNWNEVMAVLRIEVEALPEKFSPYVNADRVLFHQGSEQSGGRKLSVALLDMATYWRSPLSGVIPNEVRQKEARLPGLEVAWLLALNPEVNMAINYKRIPALIAAGLVVDSAYVPCFARAMGEVTVHSYEANSRWHSTSVVCFRE